jgi:hypothetical protein
LLDHADQQVWFLGVDRIAVSHLQHGSGSSTRVDQRNSRFCLQNV